ncbi:Glucoside xylosyltransferase 2 [Orchesella cincta]|uniref:Glucoside xylosyltransferase 2 n=1 Tax=Orchesella cincta TaxID=48709 RepID=A0A1D2MMR1_ORCCI|nr:Glucoside xylosyltransferase 2 [Orchesella cincta]
MMKSAIISAALNKVSVISFHIFLEVMERQTHFESILKELYYPRDKLQVTLHFYSVLKAVPERYHEAMIYIKKRCAFVRLFMPDQYNDKLHSACFGDIPYVPPKGVNSGVLLMNLTKMRSYGWENKVLEIFNNYSKIADLFGDQKIINILLHFERDLLKLIPCQYNYVHIFCDHGQYCKEAESDPNGIEILHGAGSQYITERFQLYEVFRMYRDFTGSHEDVYEQVMVPLRRYYENPRANSRCFGSLNRLLFKSYYENFR